MIHKIPVDKMTKEQWLKERSHSIGGSEIGAIMGLSPWASAYSVWCEKTGRFPAFEGNLATEFGTYNEPFVADQFAKRSGLKVQKTKYLYRNDKFPILHASPDRLVVGKKWDAGLECKTTNSFNASKVNGVDFPEIYYGQCVQYMMVTEKTRWFLAVLIGNSDFKMYMLTRKADDTKPEWCEGMVVVPEEDMQGLWDMAQDFQRCLDTDTPPPVDGTEATGKAQDKRSEHGFGYSYDLYGNEGLLKEYWSLKEAADAANNELEKAEQKIKEILGDNQGGECIGYKVKWAQYPGRNSFDYKACIAHNPDMAEYLKQGKPYRKFEVKKL